MTLDEIQGQNHAIGLLRRAIANGRLAHAFVFAGPAGVGKRATALAIARSVLCPEKPGVGCGSCIDCRLVGAGSHPDLFIEDLAAAQAERATASMLSIEQIRRVCGSLALRPVRGSAKVGIVDQAERLTAEAQNALLKTLEEPRGRATLVLVTSNLDGLLPTIRSRCQRLLFAPLADALVATLLEREGVAADLARRAAALAGGSLDRARELTSEEGWARCEDLRSRLERVDRLGVPERLDLAAELSPRGERNRTQQALTTATVLELFRDQMVAAARDAGPAAGPDGDYDRLAAARRAHRRLAKVYASVRDVERNANANLAWDKLLLGLGDLRA
ncbi:MAG: DNA polymerase III subunit delta' [Deltaproteobacteria bacterium]|nr:DNA polymerase III subunit delta' [Deltaproteobacteria bacterium]